LTRRRIPEQFNLFQQSCGNLMPPKKPNYLPASSSVKRP